MANILFLSIMSVLSLYHPLYISVTEIEHDEKSKALEVTMRIFIDDLELSVRNSIGNASLDIMQPGESYDTDQLLKDYVKKHFIIEVDGKERAYEYLGHEVELPVMYLYLQASNIKKVKSISVFNDMIMETHDTQSNLVHIKVNGKSKSLKLTEKNKEDTLTF